MANSGIFPIYLKAEYRSDGKAFSAFQSDAARAAQAAKAEFQGVKAALDAALTRPRTSGGSLDLGVDELRRAAQAQQEVAAAARQVAEATKRAATANGTFDASLSRSTRAAFEYAAAQERASAEMLQQVAMLDRVQAELNQVASATDQVTAANRRGQAARGAAVGSIGAERTAYIQLGQQLQDATVQLQGGTNAMLVFGQQAPQAAVALMGLANSSNATAAAVGRFATFMSGPFGAAVFVGIAALGPLVAKMFEAGEAAETAKAGANSLATAQSVLGDVFDLASGKIANQNELLRLNARLTALNLRSEALAKGASSRAVFASAGARSGADRFFGGGVSDTAAARAGIAPRQSRGQNNAATVRALLEGVRAGRISPDEALKRSERLDFTGTGATAEQFRQAIIDQAFSKDAARVAELIDQSLNSGSLAPVLRRDKKTRTRSGRSAADKAAREAERLKEFGEDAAEAIARLNARFDEQPRLVDAAAQATRELDALIKDLGERKPAGFKELIADAEKAKATVQSALVRPFEELRQESEQRLQIETLLAQGREDEAAALSEVIRLERQRGGITAEQRAEVEAIVRAEAERTRYLRDQQRLFLAQLDVVDQVQRSLTDLLSGRGGNFFGDFRQALQDLQGQRLFEDIFGQAFRDIRDELQALSPQGKANAAFAAEVERTAAATATVGDAALSLAEQFDRAFGIVGAAANRSLATIGGANDNPPQPMNEIFVTARRQPEVRIARMSVMELANRLGASIGAGLGAQLEDVFGPRFAEVFGEIAGGAIAGKVTGGNVGALFGGATKLLESGVLGNDNRISEKFGKATEGAAIGSQVAAIGKALGIKGSTTGAQLGGALGSFIPIPGGNIIGAIAGNLLGGLLKKTPRASATIGGVGGGLGLSSVTGTSASLRDAANNLGGSVLEAVNRIAEQLGASLNAGAGSVSIGQRKGNLRVDPRGRGVTKIGSGAIDFGQDAEAAIAFAVRDLINDGVITGLKASEQRLLRAGNDIEAALRDVLTFRDVFDRLREIRDPIGAAIDAVTKEFDRYRDLFRRAGADAAELADLEELASIERARVIQEATDRVAGSLKSLLDSLRLGDSGLSLRTRQGNAQSRFDALAARVAAGDASAFDDFAEISQQLLDIERQLFGSTQAYFDRLQQVTALTERAIADQTNVASISPSAPPIADEAASINLALDNQTNELASRLDAIIANQVAAAGVRSIGAGRGFDSPLPALVANF